MNDYIPEMNFFRRLTGHLKTVHNHRRLVRIHCFKCGLYMQGLLHDLSKYSPAEFWPSVRYYQGYRSPWIKERELEGYAEGWLRHKGRNKHHFEYWYDTVKGVYGPVKMPYRYMIESVCDRLAASKTYRKSEYNAYSALVYFRETPDRLYMHPDTAADIERILSMVAEEGEDVTFAKIRQSFRDHTEL